MLFPLIFLFSHLSGSPLQNIRQIILHTIVLKVQRYRKGHNNLLPIQKYWLLMYPTFVSDPHFVVSVQVRKVSVRIPNTQCYLYNVQIYNILQSGYICISVENWILFYFLFAICFHFQNELCTCCTLHHGNSTLGVCWLTITIEVQVHRLIFNI